MRLEDCSANISFFYKTYTFCCFLKTHSQSQYAILAAYFGRIWRGVELMGFVGFPLNFFISSLNFAFFSYIKIVPCLTKNLIKNFYVLKIIYIFEFSNSFTFHNAKIKNCKNLHQYFLQVYLAYLLHLL